LIGWCCHREVARQAARGSQREMRELGSMLVTYASVSTEKEILTLFEKVSNIPGKVWWCHALF